MKREAMMPVELVTVRTADGLELDGALYAARAPGPGSAVLMVHGLTWNFYRGPSRWLPPRLADAGHTVLSLNMRDHDLAAPKDFALSHRDIRAGVDHLVGLGQGTLEDDVQDGALGGARLVQRCKEQQPKEKQHEEAAKDGDQGQ